MSADNSDEEAALPPPPPPPPQDSQSNDATAPKPKKNGVGELVNTTSFARRVASGAKPLERDRELLQAVSGESNIGSSGRDTPPIDWTESVGSSFSQPQDVPLKGDSNITPIAGSSSSIATSSNNNDAGAPSSIPQNSSSSEDKSIDLSNRQMKSITHTPPVPVRKNSSCSFSSSTTKSTKNNNEKSALDAFGEYVSFFFQKAEVYEEELEIQQSQRNLLDKQHHGVSNRLLSPEGGSTSSEEGESMNGMSQHSSSTKLSPQGEALAAVEAMSNFGSFGDIRRKLKDEHSFDKVDDGNKQKKQKVEVDGGTLSSADDDGVDMTRLRKQWSSFVKEKKKNKFKEIAIESLALPLTVDEFYNQILVDNAPHSFGKFMQDIGELDVNTTPWQPPGEPTESESTTRIIHYTHPVNAPMAPPTAKARKEQFFNKVGGVGLCVQTCTFVEEVPMADCFVVEDRLWVQKNEGGGCTVAVTFQIRFVKSTYFRRIIENTTRGEYMSFFKQFHDMIISLKSPSAASDKSASEEQGELEDIAMELEQMLEGKEVPLESVLGRIRRSSMRLSAKFPSSRRVTKEEEVKVEGRQAIDLHTVISFVYDCLSYVRRQITEHDYAWAIAVAIFMFTLFFNLVALRRLGTMYGYLQSLDTKLDKMNEMNELLLAKLSDNSNICQTVVEGP